MLNFRRTGSDTAAPLTVIYQILDEDSTVQSRVGASAGPQIEWRSNDSGNNIAASRSEAYALLRSAKVTLDPTEASKQSGLRLRSEEHTSELQSLMRTSYAVFCLKKNNKKTKYLTNHT